ncbi:MAG: hypothetical protein ACHBN1_36640 [Heteroscytonema crispum UTEX LB 1556]
MNNTQKLTLQLEEPWIWEGLEAPDDPLGELSDLEMGLRRFCFECNHKVSLVIGNEKKEIFLDPDIILILDELPEEIYKLSIGQKIQLDLPESYMYIDLVPFADKISCTFTKFGYNPKQKHFELDTTQVLGELIIFLETVIRKAVDGGYITSEEKEKFLIPIRKQAIC